MLYPKISIIIATFNAARTLHVALNSILQQTYQEWECIIIDGLSKDNTIEIVKKYVEKDARFCYISEPDKGIYDAFNKGWKMAKGRWIYYLGSDDILLKNALEEFDLNVDNSDIIYGNMFFDTGSYMKKKVYKEPKFYRKGWMVSHQAIFMKRQCIEELGGFDLKYKVCGDYALIQKAIINNLKFKHINSNIAIFKCTGLTGSTYKNILEAYRVDREFHISSNTAVAFFVMLKNISFKFIRLNIKKILIFISLFVNKIGKNN